MSRTRYNILPVSLLLVIALAFIATPALAAGTVTRSMPAAAAPGATVTVTLTPSSDFTTSPGWGATETLPAGWTFVSTTADGQSVVAGAYRFVELSATPITYTVAAPAASDAYTFSGTYIDGNKNTGSVGGTTSVTVGAAATGTVASSLPATATPAATATVTLTPTPVLTTPIPTATSQPTTIVITQPPITTIPMTTRAPLPAAVSVIASFIAVLAIVSAKRK